MTDKNDVGSRIKLTREKLNLIQKDFAAELEISPPSLSEIETGRNRPGIELLVKLAERFNVNLYYILLGIGEMFANPVMDYFLQAKDYAVNVEDVRKFLEIFSKSKEMQYYILGEFHIKMMKDGNLIIENIGKKKNL
ncbi:MAG: helix-turn-helix transcriptional regulator [Candidatus Aminicenantes bacterium]|nr:helix-turn-helix transcriptional regulator [Candidatus Aminicenantes bacterium]